MKSLILLTLISISTYSTAQILVSNGIYLEFVDTLTHKLLSPNKIYGCICENEMTNGLIENNKNEFFKPKEIFANHYILKDSDENWALYTVEGEEFVFTPKSELPPNYYYPYDYTLTTADTLYTYTVAHKLKEKRYITEFEKNNTAFLKSDGNGLYGVINTEGDTIFPYEYDCTSWDRKNFGFTRYGNLSLKNSADKCGVVTYKGDTLIPFEYDYIDDLHAEHNYLYKGDLCGTVDMEGNVLIPLIYQELPYPDFNESDRNLIKLNDEWFIGDRELKPVSKDRFGLVYRPKEKYVFPGHWGSSPGKFHVVQNRMKKLALFHVDSLKYITEHKYDTIFTVLEQYICVNSENTDFYNNEGDILNSLKTKNIEIYNEKGAKYSIKLDSGYYTNHSPVYIKTVDGKKQLITTEFEIILPNLFDAFEFKLNYIISTKNGKKGLYSTDNIKILDFIYDDIKISRGYVNGYNINTFFVKKNGMWGVVDEKNEIIIPIQFSQYCETKKIYNSNMTEYLETITLEKNGVAYLYDLFGNLITEKTLKPKEKLCNAYMYYRL